MTTGLVESLGQIPLSQNLAEALARAARYATAQAHLTVTLEHLLLALTEDPDAGRVFAISGVDVDTLAGDVSSQLGHIAERADTPDVMDLRIADDLRQVLEAAAAAAEGRRNAIDGAIVLAAIVGDGRSSAAHLLSAHGLTFAAAIEALQQGPRADAAPEPPLRPEVDVAHEDPPDAVLPSDSAVPKPIPVPGPVPAPDPWRGEETPIVHHQPHGAEEILASARQRVQGRIAPGLADGHVAGGWPGSHAGSTAAARIAPEPELEQAPEPEPEPEPEQYFEMRAEAAAPHPPPQPDVVISAAEAEADAAFDRMAAEFAHRKEAESGPALPQDLAGGAMRPAPPAQRPLPPGAIRRAKSGPGHDPNLPEQRPQDLRPPDPHMPDMRVSDPRSDFGPRPVASSPARGQPPPPQVHAAGEPWPSEAAARPQHQVPLQPVGGRHPAMPMPMPHVPGHGPIPGQPPPGRPQGPSRQAPPQSMPSRPQPSPYPPFRQDAQAPGHGAATDRLPPPPKPFQPAPSARGGPPTHAAAEPPPPPPFGAPGQQHAPAHAEGQPVRPAPRTAPPAGDGHESDARQRRPGVTSFGQLVENIPRAMRIAVPAVVEARIARAEVASVAQGLSGSGAVWRHDLTITKAMSVRLRAPDGGFFIETSSPETQWIENVHGLMTDDYASWRWTVTPRTSGRKRLQLIISARTVGTDGLTAETALPDQVVEIKVRTNYRIVAKRVAGWAAAAVVGGVLARFGEGVPEIVSQLVAAVVR